eukprot:1154462-Pelagomonas_calceolata.AAC.1
MGTLPAGHPILHHHRQGAIHQPVDGCTADCSPPDPHALHERQASPAKHGLHTTAKLAYVL